MNFTNYKELITVTHTRSRNQHITHYQAERGTTTGRTFICKVAGDLEQVRAYIAEVLAHGERIKSIRNGIGQTVAL